MTRSTGILLSLLFPFLAQGQGGDAQLRAKAAALFTEQRFAEALPMYSQLVSLSPSDRELNYRYGTCLLHGGADKEKAIGHLKFAVEDPATPAQAWYWLGRAHHLNYRFADALTAYQRYKGTAERKVLAEMPVDALEQQCRNGKKLLSNLKEVTVRNKVEVAESEFFRFYDLTDIGGRIVVMPDELKTPLDRKSKRRALIYLPDKPGPIHYSSYGKEGKTGLDIYRTELLPDGRFATPQKLAGFINTDEDEDFPFLHPDGKTFYFSSKGHNSMGGYDVFKAAYDPGMDAFGRPENLDFAVNTPDDDIFYVVDPEHREACFASGRSSQQGQLHVYRVSTQRQPLIITVLKGTYASEFDANDRRARIVVEDAMSREQVADARTDMNGEYVLALPRSGRFRFLVDCGPSGKTHIGQVEVPRNEQPKAYRQELGLVRHGDQEKLVIRNYFDTPLDDDLIALAMDEIRRRARLDITEAPVVDATPANEAPVADVMTRAGFTGDIDKQAALRIAEEDAADLDRQAMELDGRAKEAWTIALEAIAEAERGTKEASALLESAANEDDDRLRDQRMTEAARLRQHAREAGQRAQAAQRTARDLENEELATRQQAAQAGKLATDLRTTLSTGKDEQALPHLTALRERVDLRGSAQAQADITERMRRDAADQERESAKALQRAQAKRGEENELADRIRRLEREEQEAKGRSRKDQIAAELTQLREQHGHLKQETAAAFAKARTMERDATLMRGQASLARHLVSTNDRGSVTVPDQGKRDGLATRIVQAQDRIEALPIDERFDAMIAASPADVEARTFDWDLATAGVAMGGVRPGTRAMDRGEEDAQRAAARSTVIASEGTADAATPKGARVEQPGISKDAPDAEEAIAARTNPGTEKAAPRTTEIQRTEAIDAPRRAEVKEVAANADDRFMLENEAAELRQMAAAERNKVRRDSLERRAVELERRIALSPSAPIDDAPAATTELGAAWSEDGEDLADARPQDPTRVPLVFGPDAKPEEIIDRLYPGYQGDKTRLERLTDADERAAGLHGLELMLADSIRGEMALQVAVLELDPLQADRVLPRVERLRKLREEHLRLAEEHLAGRQREIAELAADAGSEAPANANGKRHGNGTVGHDPILDRFVAYAEDVRQVYASRVAYRSKKVDDAVAFKDADLVRIEALTGQIDSLVHEAAGKPRKEYDRLQRNADRLRDEQLIISTDMGQRTAFLSREEWRVAQDSLKGQEKTVSKRGLPPTEPLLLMAQGMKSDAQRQFDQAAQLRKRADRIDDIMERDSLYRTAYGLELQALRELDRALTVNSHLAGGDHLRGETLTYEQVAMKVFGITETMLADARRPATPAARSREEVQAEKPAVELALRDVVAERDEAQEASRAFNAAPVAPPLVADDAVAIVRTTEAETVTERPAPAEDPRVAEARARAEADAQRREAAVAPTADEVLKRYKHFLDPDLAQLASMDMKEPAAPRLMDQRVERATTEAAALERVAVAKADRATFLEDSAATLKKGKRAEVERLAVRTRVESDSLMALSVKRNEDARTWTREQREAEDLAALRDRLSRYYYLDAEEMDMVLNDADQSRYFQAKTRALEQYDAASEADAAAKGLRELAAVLRTTAPRSPADAVQRERAAVLNTRADAWQAKADSLDNVAARLRAAASINEGQATVLLQGLSQQDPSGLMALEMRARRTEPLLGEAHAEAGFPKAPKETVTAPAPAAAVTPAPVPEAPVAATMEVATLRMPDELVSDMFELRLAGTRRMEPIPIDAAMPRGLVYKVQIGAFRRPVPEEAFSDMSPMTGERLENGVVRYMAGMFTGYEQAAAAKDKVRDRGYRDAFVVAYLDGKRVTLTEASRMGGGRPAAAVASGTATPPAATVATIERPLPAAPPAAATEVLANYPPTAEAILSAFAPVAEATSYYNVPGAAPARQVETIQGLFFTVQVGVYSRPVALDKLFNITPLNSERIEGGKVRYTSGLHLDMESARTGREQAIARGVKDAFVTAYLNGRRIPMGEANALLERFGPSILAKP
ncbi:MAG: PD40 domain-containing protein [Flavobacteriales bacterium]|nr:PD40 domain-containing protein [Flavobacteriales bacterium]